MDDRSGYLRVERLLNRPIRSEAERIVELQLQGRATRPYGLVYYIREVYGRNNQRLPLPPLQASPNLVHFDTLAIRSLAKSLRYPKPKPNWKKEGF